VVLAKSLVLLAENDSNTRERIRLMLEMSGFDVIGAEDAILAYGVLSSVRPHVIVTSIVMPRVDGVGLIRWIKNDPDMADIPIIAMSEHGDMY
jgi:CheY-like chemotaxis protein